MFLHKFSDSTDKQMMLFTRFEMEMAHYAATHVREHVLLLRDELTRINVQRLILRQVNHPRGSGQNRGRR